MNFIETMCYVKALDVVRNVRNNVLNVGTPQEEAKNVMIVALTNMVINYAYEFDVEELKGSRSAKQWVEKHLQNFLI